MSRRRRVSKDWCIIECTGLVRRCERRIGYGQTGMDEGRGEYFAAFVDEETALEVSERGEGVCHV